MEPFPIGRILGNLLRLTGGTFLSRGLGSAREILNADVYGTEGSMDAFHVAFRIPTLFRRILAEDVVERAFMPPFKRKMAQGRPEEAWRLARRCLGVMTLALVSLCILCYLLAPQLVRLLGPGLAEAQFRSAIECTYIVLPFMVLIGLAAFAGGLLTFSERNVPYSIAPAFLSVEIMVAVGLLARPLGNKALAVGYLAGGALQLLFQLPFVASLRRQDMVAVETASRQEAAIQDEGTHVGRQALFVAAQSVLMKSVEIVESRLASWKRVGSLASLWYAHRLIQLPFALFGLAIGRAVTPYLSERASLARPDQFKDGLLIGVRLNLVVFLPLSSWLILCSRDIVSLVYQRGNFTEQSLDLTAPVFACYAVGLLGMGLLSLLTRALSALERNLVPLLCSGLGAGLNLALDYLLVSTRLEHAGLALAASIAFTTNAILLSIGVQRWLRRHEMPLRWGEVVPPVLKLLAFTGIASLVGYMASSLSPDVLSIPLEHLLRLAIIGCAMGFTYSVCIFLSPTDEAWFLLKRFGWRRNGRA